MAKMNLEAPFLTLSPEVVRVGQMGSWQIQIQRECRDGNSIPQEQETGVKEYKAWVEKCDLEMKQQKN